MLGRRVAVRVLSSRVPIPPLPSRDEWWGREAGSQVVPSIDPSIRQGNLDYRELRRLKLTEIEKLSEWQQMESFQRYLDTPSFSDSSKVDCQISRKNLELAIEAAFATMAISLESRIAALLGQGFYTIGPGGEELAAVFGLVLRPTDAMALHYRHLGAQIARQLAAGKSVQSVLLDRARGHVLSIYDPATSAAHCAIGGGKYDFLVTSTLASQCPPAVGRALGASLAKQLGQPSIFPSDFVSFVSLGDGSVNHAHFLSASNLAEYASFRKYKCPVVFCVTDNGLSISLKGHGWLESEFLKRYRMKVFQADGNEFFDIWQQSFSAIEYSRTTSKPSLILLKNVPRRFGHAATDRQSAYLTEEEIQSLASRNPVINLCRSASSFGVSYSYLSERLSRIRELSIQAFQQAVKEPKITSRSEISERNSSSLVPLQSKVRVRNDFPLSDRHVMRKHMTAIYDELLSLNPNMVYIGEDVIHGGYYLVTDGLAKKYPHRIQDFPPDEGTLIGAGMGFSQAGLIPVVEIPYAKYLDCGADMFFEAVMMNWLSNGKQQNGMILRLQGFDRGIFGGNFHTHNMLHIPPGLDVVCYSNGPDYARGLRYSLEQARQGRVVMTVDCTNLLNLHHVTGHDYAWRFPYTESDEMMRWDEVRIHGEVLSQTLGIVTYGNGVVTALQAREFLLASGFKQNIVIVDAPYLSAVTNGLRLAMAGLDSVVFADICKHGQNPLAGHVTRLHSENRLPPKWRCIAAQRTYNPLGSTLTFLNVEDIVDACKSIYM